MSTRYDLSDPKSREDGLAAAVTAVRRGQLVILPTDTVYGVGVDAFDAEGVQRLLDAKGRGRDMPPPVLISSDTTLEALATDVPGLGERTDRAVLARPPDHRVPAAALAALGPRGDPRDGGHPDARRPGSARPARSHRPARRLVGQHHRPTRRHQRRRRRGDARLGGRGGARRRCRATARSPPPSSTAPAPGRACCARAPSARPSSPRSSRGSVPSSRPTPSPSPSPSPTRARPRRRRLIPTTETDRA